MAKPVEERFTSAGLQLIRTIGSDDVLAKELVLELARRKIDLTAPAEIPHIALISEWDTLYGRSLPRTFVAVAKGTGGRSSREQKETNRRLFRHWRRRTSHGAVSELGASLFVSRRPRWRIAAQG